MHTIKRTTCYNDFIQLRSFVACRGDCVPWIMLLMNVASNNPSPHTLVRYSSRVIHHISREKGHGRDYELLNQEADIQGTPTRAKYCRFVRLADANS